KLTTQRRAERDHPSPERGGCRPKGGGWGYLSAEETRSGVPRDNPTPALRADPPLSGEGYSLGASLPYRSGSLEFAHLTARDTSRMHRPSLPQDARTPLAASPRSQSPIAAKAPPRAGWC